MWTERRKWRTDWWMDHSFTSMEIHTCLSCPDNGITAVTEEGEVRGEKICSLKEKEIPAFPFIPSWCPKIRRKLRKYVPSHSCLDATERAWLDSIPIEEVENRLSQEAEFPLSLRVQDLSSEAREIVQLVFRSPADLIGDSGKITRQTIRNFFSSRWGVKMLHSAIEELRDFANSF